MEKLVIPLSLDSAETKRKLEELAETGGGAGKKIEEGMLVGQGGVTGLASSLLGVQSGLGLVTQFATAMGAATKDASDYITKVVDKFTALREIMRGMAALEGKLPSNANTADVIEQTKATGVLTPTEFVGAKEAFQQFGSGYVGEGAGKKINQADLNTLLPDIMAYAKLRKMSPQTAMRGLSSIIQAMPAGTPPEKYKEVFARVMEASEFSRGSAELSMQQFIPLAAENVGEGLPFGEGQEGLEKAITFLGVQQEAHAGEAYTYTRDFMQGVEHLRKSGKAEELGITEEDDPKTIAGKIGAKWQESGIKSFKQWWRPFGGGHGGLQASAAIQTAIDKDIKGGGFEATEESIGKQDASTFDARLGEMKGSDLGQAYRQQQRQEIADLDRGQLYLRAEKAKAKAKEELTKEGYFDSTGFAQLYRQTVGRAASGGASPEEQAVGQRAIQDQLESMYPGDKLSQLNEATDSFGSGLSYQGEIERLLRKQNEMMERDGQRPLSAPAPPGDGR